MTKNIIVEIPEETKVEIDKDKNIKESIFIIIDVVNGIEEKIKEKLNKK